MSEPEGRGSKLVENGGIAPVVIPKILRKDSLGFGSRNILQEIHEISLYLANLHTHSKIKVHEPLQ